MLVIGFRDNDNFVAHHILDIDIDADSPRKIHDMLKRTTGGGDFTSIVCISEEEVQAVYYNEEDYDLAEDAEEDEIDEEDIDNDDDLHDLDEDEE